jgi:hypothetical protein
LAAGAAPAAGAFLFSSTTTWLVMSVAAVSLTNLVEVLKGLLHINDGHFEING